MTDKKNIEHINKILCTPVDSLFLRRTSNCLFCEEIYVLNDIKLKNFKSKDEVIRFLIRIPNFGRKSLKDFEEIMRNHGIEYSDLILNEEEQKFTNIGLLKSVENEVKKLEYRINQVNNQCNSLDMKLKSMISESNFKSNMYIFTNEMQRLSESISFDINNKLVDFHKQIGILEYRIKEIDKNETNRI